MVVVIVAVFVAVGSLVIEGRKSLGGRSGLNELERLGPGCINGGVEYYTQENRRRRKGGKEKNAYMFNT